MVQEEKILLYQDVSQIRTSIKVVGPPHWTDGRMLSLPIIECFNVSYDRYGVTRRLFESTSYTNPHLLRYLLTARLSAR